jgi:hypothetical protein
MSIREQQKKIRENRDIPIFHACNLTHMDTEYKKKKICTITIISMFNLMINSYLVCYEKSQAIDKYILFVWLQHTTLVDPSYLIHSSKSLKGAERSKKPCLVSFSRYIIEVKLYIYMYIESCHASSIVNRMIHICIWQW